MCTKFAIQFLISSYFSISGLRSVEIISSDVRISRYLTDNYNYKPRFLPWDGVTPVPGIDAVSLRPGDCVEEDPAPIQQQPHQTHRGSRSPSQSFIKVLYYSRSISTSDDHTNKMQIRAF